jgi:hypothetical protein
MPLLPNDWVSYSNHFLKGSLTLTICLDYILVFCFICHTELIPAPVYGFIFLPLCLWPDHIWGFIYLVCFLLQRFVTPSPAACWDLAVVSRKLCICTPCTWKILLMITGQKKGTGSAFDLGFGLLMHSVCWILWIVDFTKKEEPVPPLFCTMHMRREEGVRKCLLPPV